MNTKITIITLSMLFLINGCNSSKSTAAEETQTIQESETVEESEILVEDDTVSIPICSDEEKLINNLCIPKTCEDDDYNCPISVLSDEPYYKQQWYLHYDEDFYMENNINPNSHINMSDAYNTYTGKGVKIAIIDDGLDVSHEDIKDGLITKYNLETKDDDVSHDVDDEYHGTAVTGIVGARANNKGIYGIANQADIIFIKYANEMSDSQTIELFSKAEEFGADIINCSWGTYDVSEAVKEKIIDLSNNGRDGKGTIIVFASGNDNENNKDDESSISEVISVGATNKDNELTWYSNYGRNLDIVAPGGYSMGITTLDPMDDSGISSLDDNYILYNDSNSFIGTSAAAPIVSGAIALLLEKDPSLTRVEIEDILHNNSDQIGNIPYRNGHNDYYGYGKLNVNNILK